MLARDGAFEVRLREEAGTAYDKLKADPARAKQAGAIRARLAAAHAKASTKS